MPWYRLLDLAGVSTLEESALWRGPDIFPLSFLADVVKKGRRTALRRGSNLGGWGRLMSNFMATLIAIMKSLNKRGQRPTRPCMDRAKVCQEYSRLQDWWGFLERVNALAAPKCLLHHPSEASRPRTSRERPHSESTRPLSTIGERSGISPDIRALHFYLYPREHHLKCRRLTSVRSHAADAAGAFAYGCCAACIHKPIITITLISAHRSAYTKERVLFLRAMALESA
jgi:hypothetical protein